MIQHPDKNFIDPIPIEIHKQPASCAHVEEEFDGNPWFHDIKEYMEKGEYPENIAHIQSARFEDWPTISLRVEEFCIEGLLIWDYCDESMPMSDMMKSMCETFKIKHQNSTAYKPQMNGVIEVANKSIKKILRKMVDNYKQWHEKLPFALLGIIQETKLSDAEWIQSRYEQLALIDEKRMNAVCHGQLYHNRIARAFNKKFRSTQFTLGKLVLKRIFPHQDEAKRKFSPNWQGPYMVHLVLTGGALILAEMDGEISPKPINSDAVKRYYV
ncbi:uncharacterized protein [Nicotiana tomentosiformis]|uniref:uncharacterized protein n=1 Tax=Nicotiana tomentosiformis TaxID=4098 RepID=UPI00388C401D